MNAGCTRNNTVAVVGMACRFPGADDLDGLWRLLCAGEDPIGVVPAERWNVDALYDPDPSVPGKLNSRWGGFLDGLDRFDARFFGISTREANQLDPRQRLALEVGWEALEDAGIPPDRLAGTTTGVFVGTLAGDYDYQVIARRPHLIDAYSGAGTADSVVANRLSYALDLRGPSLSVDTACSGSLVAVLLACRSLLAGECELALAGGVNVVLDPGPTMFFAKAGALAPDGRCKTFDRRANGIVRSEGAGVVVLKRLEDAIADGDRIWSVVLGGSMNHDGSSNGIMAPSVGGQEALLRAAYRSARVSPGDVQLVETHGTGTQLGDPIEVEALGRVLVDGRDGRLCKLGAVKSNLGHLEAAAGAAGLIKVGLALRHRRLPPNLHFEEPNPLIPFERLPFAVQNELGPWPDEDRPLIAGVSSFGIGGSNAHLVLGEAPAAAPPAAVPGGPQVLCLSARSTEALEQLAARWRDLAAKPSVPTIGDLCAAAAHRRPALRHRLAVVTSGREDLAATLDRYLAAGADAAGNAVATGCVAYAGRGRLAFLFSGQGSQWPGMGRDLAARFETFAAAHRDVLTSVGTLCGSDFAARVAAAGDDDLGQTEVLQTAVFAVQVALAALWRNLGVAPDLVLGQSLGEVAAAHVAGALDLDSAVRVIVVRSRLMARLAGQGATLWVALPAAETAARAAAVGGEMLWLAGELGPRASVVAGTTAAVERLARDLAAEGTAARRLRDGSVPFHGPAMEPLAVELAAALADLQPRQAEVELHLATRGGVVAGDELDGSYWADNLRQPFRLGATLVGAVEAGAKTFLEISPHPSLLRTVDEVLADAGVAGRGLPSLRRGDSGTATFLASFAQLQVGGVGEAAALSPAGAWVDLPHNPWQRERYWFDQLPGAECDMPTPGSTGGDALLGRMTQGAEGDVRLWERDLALDSLHFLDDHLVDGRPVVPGALWLEMACAAAAEKGGTGAALEGVELDRFLPLAPDEPRRLQVLVRQRGTESASFVVASRPAGDDGQEWTVHARGRFADAAGAAADGQTFDLGALRREHPRELPIADHYRRLESFGYRYGDPLRTVREAWRGKDGALCRLALAPELATEADGYRCHPAILDGALQSIAAAVDGEGAALVPAGVARYVCDLPVGPETWCRVRLQPEAQGGGAVLADLDLLDLAGCRRAAVTGVRLLPRGAAQHGDRRRPERSLYGVEWQEDEDGLPWRGALPARSWLVVGDPDDPLVQGLARSLGRARGTSLAPVVAELTENRLGELARVSGGDGGVVLVAPSAAGNRVGIAERATSACQRLLAAVRAAARPGSSAPARLWLITRGAQRVLPDEAVSDPAAAAWWGMARCLAVEHPELWGGLLDLPAEASADRPGDDEASVRLVVERLVRGLGGTVALRGGGCWRPRLAVVAPAGEPPRLRADATYLVAGAFAGIAAPVLDWLVERGARRLLLVTRQPLPERRSWSALAAAPENGSAGVVRRIDVVRQLEARGVAVHVAGGIDLADTAAVDRLLADHADGSWPPVRGVVYLAGELRDRLLGDLSDEDLERVLASKIAGSVNLHRRLPDAELFLLYSSLSSLLPPPGQAAYAAAGAVLDALAQRWASAGQAAWSLGWGPWSGTGMAARALDEDDLRQRGLRPFDAVSGGAALAAAVRGAGGHRVIVDAEWALIAARGEAGEPGRALIADLTPPPPATTGGAAGVAAPRDLREIVDQGERRAVLTERLTDLVSRVMRLDPTALEPDQPLAELGIDSIVAIELKTLFERELDLALPITWWLEGPSVRRLVDEAEGRLAAAAAARSEAGEFIDRAGAA